MKKIEKIIKVKGKKFFLVEHSAEFLFYVSQYYKRNFDFFQLAIPNLNEKFYEFDHQADAYFRELDLSIENKFIRLYIFPEDNYNENDTKIIGDISLSNIESNFLKNAILGYKIDKDYSGQGLMFEFLKIILPILEKRYKLNRFTSYVNYQNTNSLKLLEKLGFTSEALLKNYLFDSKKWIDFYQYSRIKNL